MYASVKDFVQRVGEGQALDLTDRDHTGAINNSVLNIALRDSSAQIDSYLDGRYTLPLSHIPANLTRLCCDLARYHLCGMTNVTITDDIFERYKLCLKELEMLASGKISLGVEQEIDACECDSSVMFSNGNTRIFSRDHKD